MACARQNWWQNEKTRTSEKPVRLGERCNSKLFLCWNTEECARDFVRKQEIIVSHLSWNKSTFDVFGKEWKHKSRKTVTKSFDGVERVSMVKQNSSTRSQIIKVVTQNRCARFLWRNAELVLFGGCLIEVKLVFEISRPWIWQNFAFFFYLEETLVCKFSFLF